jgi:hypothetical protein
MRTLAVKALGGGESQLHDAEISRLFDEIATISSKLIPILHFQVDEVDWDK